MDCALLPGLLAEALVDRTHPGIERVFFTNSGAEAIETAIKFARCATGRDRILYCDHAFHGLTNGALSLNGGREFRDGFGPLLPKVRPGPLRRHRRAGAASCGAATWPPSWSSPSRARASTWPPTAYWPEAQALCRRHGTLLVIDEVQTGLGRTGRFFCHEHWDLQPDIITVSKALSGGYMPVGAVLTSAKVFDAVYSSMDRAVVHSSTFSTEPAGHGGRAGHPPGHRRRGHRRPGRAGTASAFMEALGRWSRSTSSSTRCGASGLMIGLVFGAPRHRARPAGPVPPDGAGPQGAVLAADRGARCSTGTASSPRWPPTT